MIRRLDASASGFATSLAQLLRIPEDDQLEIRGTVERILSDVKVRGDQALVDLTNQFDRQSVSAVAELKIDAETLRQAYENLEPLIQDALNESVNRVRRYHQEQLRAIGGGENWQFTDELGNILGQQVQSMERVGIYAPGGKAAYPSTIIMTAIPAQVAGVNEIILCVPTPGGELNETLLASAHLCGVDEVFAVGGAQAIAAMTYGTESIAAVDKIVGPGNIYVATAKELVFGAVGIDMIAGPSEVVVIADSSAVPELVVLDMFAQAEHDERAQAILISPDSDLLDKVADILPDMLLQQSRSAIIAVAIDDRGALIQVSDIDQALELANQIAPEHLQLAVKDASQYLGKVTRAGAIFVGIDTTEVVGDYTAGPSHVLPTNGTARFASPLGVYDFQTRTSVVECSREGAIQLNRSAAIIATEEGLDAHAQSASSRVKG